MRFQLSPSTSLWLCLLATLPAFALPPVTRSSVLDSSGRWTSGGAVSNLSASGQPGGITVSADNRLVNYAGFLNSFALCPELDADADGLANEFDSDNDNDSLNDVEEITGSAFQPQTPTDPNRADTDNDGASDGAEAVAGTDPTDEAANFRITSVSVETNGVTLGWVARSNKTYRVWNGDSLTSVRTFTNPVATATATGPGAPPWYATTEHFTDTNAMPRDAWFYRIQVLP